jgi:hypothetical protein
MAGCLLIVTLSPTLFFALCAIFARASVYTLHSLEPLLRVCAQGFGVYPKVLKKTKKNAISATLQV